MGVIGGSGNPNRSITTRFSDSGQPSIMVTQLFLCFIYQRGMDASTEKLPLSFGSCKRIGIDFTSFFVYIKIMDCRSIG